MSGWELADYIRNYYEPNIKIATLSGWGSQITKSKMDEHKVDYLLNKPFKKDDLLNLLDKFQN